MKNIDNLIIDALMNTRNLSLSIITEAVNSKGTNASTSDVRERLESLAKNGTVGEDIVQEIINN